LSELFSQPGSSEVFLRAGPKEGEELEKSPFDDFR
jgi:hypothetical protein